MRKHEGDTRVRNHSRIERFLPPDHATEQAIVQIGHRRFLQLANRFSMLACCLASGSGTGVGQLFCFVARQIQDRTEVSHLRDGVRFTGPAHFASSFFGMRDLSRGILPEIGWFSSTRKRDAGRKGLCQKAVVPMTWPYARRLFATAKCECREAPGESPPGASR